MALLSLSASAQYVTKQGTPKGAGDLIESTSFNDHKRGQLRRINYLPDGNDFVCVNGENRYTRALYGGNSAFRVETSDRPIFGLFEKGKHRNIRFYLRLSSGVQLNLEESEWCEARYTAGKRSYRLKDEAWGVEAELQLTVWAAHDKEAALWQFQAKGFPVGTTLVAEMCDIVQPKLSRSGDLGADPPRVFDPALNPSFFLEQVLPLSDGSLYLQATPEQLITLLPEVGEELCNGAEVARAAIASQLRMVTPDPYLNTLGGALSSATDGIWDGEVWLHGAVGWRMPLSGWRAAYVGDALGWHDRARIHFNAYAASQVVDVVPTIPHPSQDATLALARSEKRWGTNHYSNGYICRNPHRNNQMHHYNMNLCYMDELLWHFNWTGDWDYIKQMWPVIVSHLAWEKRNFDPDNDGLYDAYASIWASDALYYNSGAVTHASAYNYRSHKLAALIAERIGEDPTPYQTEANRILKGLNEHLWMNEKGHWAEYKDYMGHKRLHESAAVWTIYHALDSEVATPFQAYLTTRYIDQEIPHLAVEATVPPAPVGEWQQQVAVAAQSINRGGYATVSTTNWLPYAWSINNVAFAEVMHTALAYFQAGRSEEGFKLLKSSVLDGMYLGDSPGNFGQISFYDAARGECYRDFGDPIGVASRLLVQGLYGILPDAMNERLVIRPGFPVAWPTASLQTPSIAFDFVGLNPAEGRETYRVTHSLPAVKKLVMQLPARRERLVGVTVNGKSVAWKCVAESVGKAVVTLEVAAQAGDEQLVMLQWQGEALDYSNAVSTGQVKYFSDQLPVTFVEVKQGEMQWWQPVEQERVTQQLVDGQLADGELGIGELSDNKFVASKQGRGESRVEAAFEQGVSTVQQGALSVQRGVSTFEQVLTSRCEPVVMDNAFNASVNDIFRNEYLSPRSPYTTLQIPKQGIGEWCHPLHTVNIDDSGMRGVVKAGVLETELGIPFRTPAVGKNILFTSLWDNYPAVAQFTLKGKAQRAYLLLAGSTNHMQCHIANGVIRLYYQDGSSEVLELVNPTNWAPIEHLFFEDGKAFNRHAPALYRLHFKTGRVSNCLGKELGYPGVTREVDGGAGTLLELRLDARKELSHVEVETLSNDVVIGVMAVTLQR